MNKVYCDRCNKKFKIKVRTEEIKDDVKRVYFICPKCKKEYTAYYTNNKIKDLQEQIRNLRGEYNKLRGKNFKDGYKKLQEITKLQNKIEKEMDILKSIYGQLDT